MAKDFPDVTYAYHPPAVTDEAPMPVVKVVPMVPASQADRPQLRPVPSE